jgi:hypothetical protein
VKEYAPDSKHKPDILNNAMGRSGNLRAPTMILGSTCYIGFNQDMFDSMVKNNS